MADPGGVAAMATAALRAAVAACGAGSNGDQAAALRRVAALAGGMTPAVRGRRDACMPLL